MLTVTISNDCKIVRLKQMLNAPDIKCPPPHPTIKYSDSDTIAASWIVGSSPAMLRALLWNSVLRKMVQRLSTKPE